MDNPFNSNLSKLKFSAFLIAGTHSGCGKTTISLGLMAALRAKGFIVQPFKCGPDFIDPTLHKRITGINSRNLDIRMCGADFVRKSFVMHSANADVAIIEGVMGMFDGGEASSASLAKLIGLPVLLVLDVSSCAESAAAILKGFEEFDPACNLKAVVLNNIASSKHFELASQAIKKHCKAEVVGFFAKNANFRLKSRHLGLKMGHETDFEQDELQKLAETISESIDLQRLLEITRTYKPEPDFTHDSLPISSKNKVRIAVSMDEAFCFYYHDNLDLLTEAGAELVFFSPIRDQKLPENISGVWLSGGYPELYTDKLSQNHAMLAALKDWVESGGVTYAECGGFMYLCSGIETDGQFSPMVGIFPVRARMQKKLASLGYRQVSLIKDTIFGQKGTILHGHEFHYSTTDEIPQTILQVYDKWQGYAYKNVLASYVHLHFGQTPEAARAFVERCQEGLSRQVGC